MDNRIGDFLRARRELVRPEDVGLEPSGRRRVPGLRREELALLAGVSADYYVRLEQGRDRHPSAQVLEALARVLQLDEDATAHLHELATAAPRRRARARVERVRPSLLQMMEAWPNSPAFITGRRFDVLAANRLAEALYPVCATRGNIVRTIFLDPEGSCILYAQYDQVAADTVAALRATSGADVDDPELISLVGELSLKSDAFRRLWARHDVRAKTEGQKLLNHPLVGEVTVRYETFTVNGAEGQQLVVYHAEPGSPSERALNLLASIVAGEPAREVQHQH
ncbi:helix-turn-helix transcriptional regulator [Solirubrobacter phytolaccae]|uniref:Helix-turn-helix transcriptional regulator n=1 Tax=Solirubrobacter phytolaccae TaxID=1404360 RepID=A0A9X3SIT7_9ACTN|nr:helix-turn-helix transcriptional regulator [Solirubrobacter phytolaccae]MDA0184502.1 helix-turn-helix transcriptional regulator [Solirubrobacter phytolaccae]